jgi:hypothetical protein
MFGWIRMFGDSEASVRLPALAAGIGTVALLPPLGRLLVTPLAGWVAAWFLAVSPVHIWYSHEARPYSLLMLASVAVGVAYGILERAHEDRRVHRWFIASALVLSMTHFYGILLVAALALVSIRRPSRETVLTALLLSVVFLGALIVLKMTAGALRSESWYLRAFTPGTAWELFAGWFLLAGTRPSGFPGFLASLYVLVALAPVVFWLARGSVAPPALPRHVVAALMVAVPVAMLGLAVIGRDHYFIERSALSSLPFFALGIGAGVDSLPRHSWRALAGGVLVAGSLVVLTQYWQHHDRPSVSYPKADWRSVSARIALHAQTAGRPTVVVSATPLNELQYYRPGARRCSLPTLHRKPGADRTRATDPVCVGASFSGDRLYVVRDVDMLREVLDAEGTAQALVVEREFWPGPPRTFVAEIEAAPDMRLEALTTALGLRLFRVDRRGAVSATTAVPAARSQGR